MRNEVYAPSSSECSRDLVRATSVHGLPWFPVVCQVWMSECANHKACNSIMFPTIFSLASEGLGRRAAAGSGIIGVAIVGGAVVPPLTGHMADLIGLPAALLVPAICYAGILAYGIYARRPAVPDSASASSPSTITARVSSHENARRA